jgi:hypothetical protein
MSLDAGTASRLEQLQAAFQAYLLDEPGDFAAAVAAPAGVDAAARLAIYHHAYRARLVDALRDSYGHTAQYLGDERFRHEALAYLAEHPPRHANLRWYGDALAPWLARRHPGAPELAELAALDAALRRAFDGPDAPALQLADLAAVPPAAWPQALLRFHPTCECLQLHGNTVEVWQALDDDREPPPPVRHLQPQAWLVWRSEWTPRFRSLGPVEAAALEWLHGGMDFGTCCERLAQHFPAADITREAGLLLRRWADDGVLARIDTVPAQAEATNSP